MIKMTRAEYEAKYGAPVSKVAASFPKKMTRAEYTAKYGELGTVDTKPQDVLGAGLSAGLESAKNLPSSFGRFVGGIKDVVLHPLKTAGAIGNVAIGAVEKAIPGAQKEEENFNQFASFLKERYGSLENLEKTATEDPFAFGADVLGVLQGGAGLVGKTAQLNTGISAAGKLATTPVSKTASAVGSGIAKTTEFGVSQATGLNPATLSTIVENPSQFTRTARASIDRPSLASDVKGAIDTRLKALRDTGAGYNEIRNTEAAVQVNPGTVESVLGKYGVKMQIDETGKAKVLTTAESRPLSGGDRAALEDFYNTYGREKTLSPNAFLNAREALSNLAKYDQTKTNISTTIARDLRNAYDTVGKDQIPKLKELDAAYAPERELLNQAKKDFLTAKGELKDAAISKVANSTGAGKDQLLARLEELSPGITQRIRVLKAVEDIEHTSGIKVGTYARALGVGGQAISGNILGAIVTAILTAPEVAVPLIRGYGLTKPKIASVLMALRSGTTDVNNFRMPVLKGAETVKP
jgi:hypothetical protein